MNRLGFGDCEGREDPALGNPGENILFLGFTSTVKNGQPSIKG